MFANAMLCRTTYGWQIPIARRAEYCVYSLKQDTEASDFIVQTAQLSHDWITTVALGTLSNVARAIVGEPGLNSDGENRHPGFRRRDANIAGQRDAAGVRSGGTL